MGLTSREKAMADERTPLFVTVRTAPPRHRYPHHTLRRFCTIALTSSLLALFAVFLLTFAFFSLPPGPHHHHRPEWSWPDCHDRKLSYVELKEVLLETPSSDKAEEWQRYYTAGAHLAGQNYSQVCHVVNGPEDGIEDMANQEIGPLDKGEVGGVGHPILHC